MDRYKQIKKWIDALENKLCICDEQHYPIFEECERDENISVGCRAFFSSIDKLIDNDYQLPS